MAVRTAPVTPHGARVRHRVSESSTSELLIGALALAILSVPMILSVVSVGEWLNAAFPLAFVIGAVLRPKRLWPIWLGSILLMWAVYGYATYVAQLMPAPGEPAAGETVWTFAIESALFMSGLVLLPAWLGRRARGS